MNMHRVVVTGMGVVSPLGNSIDEMWNNIQNGNTGIAPIKRFDTQNYKVSLAAEVKSFDPLQYLKNKELKRLDLYSQYAIFAAGEAISMSGLHKDILSKESTGVIVGTGMGGISTIEKQSILLHEKGPGKVNFLTIPMLLSSIAAGNIAIKFGIKGICTSIVTACATGTNCIGEAFRNIQHGYSDIIVAGGSEASITPIAIAGFTELTALSTETDFTRASIPFDKDENGFVMGEGAGMLILEELNHALKRNANIYGEIIGYGTNCDAYHITSPNPNGQEAARAIRMALKDGNVKLQDVSYINAHGTSTSHNDITETLAIKEVFGNFAYKIPVSSTKSMTGHLLGAAGALEAIITIKSLCDGFVPPTVGLKIPNVECDLDYVPYKGFKKDIKIALSNSFGFGGHNAVLCIRKWEG